MGAAPIGAPGCPEFAFWTASIERVRIVSMASRSRSVAMLIGLGSQCIQAGASGQCRPAGRAGFGGPQGPGHCTDDLGILPACRLCRAPGDRVARLDRHAPGDRDGTEVVRRADPPGSSCSAT
jgi:hypothetical protein